MISSSQATGCGQSLLATRLLSQAATSTSGKCDVPEGHQNSDLSPTACHIGLNRRRDLSLRQDLCLFRPEGKATLKDIFKVCWVQQAGAAGSSIAPFCSQPGRLSRLQHCVSSTQLSRTYFVQHGWFLEYNSGLRLDGGPGQVNEVSLGHFLLKQLGLNILQCCTWMRWPCSCSFCVPAHTTDISAIVLQSKVVGVFGVPDMGKVCGEKHAPNFMQNVSGLATNTDI